MAASNSENGAGDSSPHHQIDVVSRRTAPPPEVHEDGLHLLAAFNASVSSPSPRISPSTNMAANDRVARITSPAIDLTNDRVTRITSPSVDLTDDQVTLKKLTLSMQQPFTYALAPGQSDRTSSFLNVVQPALPLSRGSMGPPPVRSIERRSVSTTPSELRRSMSTVPDDDRFGRFRSESSGMFVGGDDLQSIREESDMFFEQPGSMFDLEDDGFQQLSADDVQQLPATVQSRLHKNKWQPDHPSRLRTVMEASEEESNVVEVKDEPDDRALDITQVTQVPHASANGSSRTGGFRPLTAMGSGGEFADATFQRAVTSDHELDGDYESPLPDDDEDEDENERAGSSRGKRKARPKSAKANGKEPMRTIEEVQLPSDISHNDQNFADNDENTTGDNYGDDEATDESQFTVGAEAFQRAQSIHMALAELEMLKAKKGLIMAKIAGGQGKQEDHLDLRMLEEQIERDWQRIKATEEDIEEIEAASMTRGRRRGQGSGRGGSRSAIQRLMTKSARRGGRKSGASMTPFDGRSAVTTGRKRAAPAERGGGVNKRARGRSAASLAGISRLERSRRTTDAATQMMFEMVRDADPIMARAGQGDVPLPPALQTNSVRKQVAHIREQYANNPNDQARVDNDIRNLAWARGMFGPGKCKARNGMWLVRGMKTTLYHYQLFGAGWMLNREKEGSRGVFGGIQADAMGMGKTLMCIATICGNKATEDEMGKGRGTTLIVSPASAVKQWVSELKQHSRLDAMVYSERKDIPIGVLEKCQVIVTSYNEVQRSHPSESVVNELASMGLTPDEYNRRLGDLLGSLYKIQFHRIILDEGHQIKNYHSSTSKAAIHLRSKLRWVVTGTPIQNTLAELYPYMRFLRAKFSANWVAFKNRYGVPNTDAAMNELTNLLYAITLRRNLDALFLGLPIHSLPKTHPLPIRWLTFSKEEQVIYRRIETRFREDLNRRLAEGSVKKNLIGYFSLLLRLRMATAHPFLSEKPMMDVFVLEDIRWLRMELKKIGGKRPIIDQIGAWAAEIEERGEGIPGDVPIASMQGNNGGEGPSNTPGNDDNGGEGPSNTQHGDDGNVGEGPATNAAPQPPLKHGMCFDFDAALALAERRQTGATTTCGLCLDPPLNPYWTSCGHVFCLTCIEASAAQEAEDGNELLHCPEAQCGVEIESPAPFKMPTESDVDISDPEDEEREKEARLKQRKQQRLNPLKRGPRKRGDDVNSYQPHSMSGARRFLREADTNPDIPLLSSSKSTATYQAICAWQEEAPDDKIIVFTQFVVFAQVLGRVLQDSGIGFLYYFGDMAMDMKAQWIEDFRNRPEIKVMIVSMRCGGQALNLTMANRVINVDTWYHHAMEMQAFGRVFRIGQTKETYFLRLMVKNTVDVRLFDMQEEKMRHIGRAVRDHDGMQRHHIGLNEHELASLMGRMRFKEGENGKKQLVVESDYEDDPEEVAVQEREQRDAVDQQQFAQDFRQNQDAPKEKTVRVIIDSDSDSGSSTEGMEVDRPE